MRVLLIVILTFAAGSTSWARVFNINNESFAPYVVFGGAGSSISAKPFQGETAEDLKYSDGSALLYSGEFGFLYSRSFFNFRFGFEILKPPASTIDAFRTNTKLYSVGSEITGYIPKIGLELNLHGDKVSRSFISFSYGASTVTFKNDYQLTADGQTAFPGLADHSTELKGSTPVMTAALGYEGFLSDSTTLLVEFGYRMMKINNWTYTKDASTFSGSYTTGQDWLKQDGSKREIDFSGAFITLGFRFYL